MTVRNARKRDGNTIQPFDVEKLRRAITKAWVSVTEVDEKAFSKVVGTVMEAISGDTVDVETIQDAVEVSLMKHKQFDVAKAYIVHRHERAAAREARIQSSPDPKAISDYIHASKYARYVPELGRREVYEESVARVEAMHLEEFPHMEGEIVRAFDFVREKKLLPSMRSLQFSGPAIQQNHNRLFNCAFSLIDRMDAFGEALFLLLAGCGVGYSVQLDHVEKLPQIPYINVKSVRHHVIADTIEGWADALKALTQSFVDGVNIEFSYHLIREAGSPLKTSGGRAPGHLKLKDSLERIRGVLSAAQGRKMRPIECHRIMCFAADAVLSGGIRRSAMLALFSLDDSEMLNAKTGNWYVNDPWFSNANNSVALKRDEVKKKQFKRVFQMIKQWGEPGFYFTGDYNYGCNPCFHPETRLWTSKGYEKVIDLFKAGTANTVVRDVRVGKGDAMFDTFGVSTAVSTNVFLTQTQAPVFKLTTEHGYSVTVTDTHEFPTPSGRKQLKDLAVGDTLLLPSGEGQFGSGGTLDEGFLLGMYVGDGTSTAQQAYVDLWEDDFDLRDYLLATYNSIVSVVPVPSNSRSYGVRDWSEQVTQKDAPLKVRVGGTRLKLWLNTIAGGESELLKKRVPNAVWSGSREFVVGYLQGFFASDGTVLLGGKGSKATLSVRLTQANKALLEDVQTLLSMFGVVSKLYSRVPAGYRLLPDNKGKGESKPYLCREVFELIINRPNAVVFKDLIGLRGRKADILSQYMTVRGTTSRKPERYITQIASIEEAGVSDVYCLTQPETNCVTANGIVTGQCAEINLNPVVIVDKKTQEALKLKGVITKQGESYTGWALCNLVEINASKMTSLDDFMAVAKAATLIGTLQAAYTKMPYLGGITEHIAEREALLGIGMTGMLDAPHIACNPDFQRQVADKTKEWNRAYAKAIGIEPAARITTVKPAGTTSLLLGSVGSGHHPHHARRYIRRVTADELEFVFQAFRKVNPHMCVRKPDGKWVIEFPVEAPAGATVKSDLNAIEFLEMVKSTQQNWVVSGTAREDISPGLNHNVSNTVTVGSDEWEKVADYLWDNREMFTGVSLLPDTGDKDYAFAPMEAITTPADEARWNAILASYKPVNYKMYMETDDTTNLSGELACAGGMCAIV